MLPVALFKQQDDYIPDSSNQSVDHLCSKSMRQRSNQSSRRFAKARQIVNASSTSAKPTNGQPPKDSTTQDMNSHLSICYSQAALVRTKQKAYSLATNTLAVILLDAVLDL